jgi:hypothetical protein
MPMRISHFLSNKCEIHLKSAYSVRQFLKVSCVCVCVCVCVFCACIVYYYLYYVCIYIMFDRYIHTYIHTYIPNKLLLHRNDSFIRLSSYNWGLEGQHRQSFQNSLRKIAKCIKWGDNWRIT